MSHEIRKTTNCDSNTKAIEMMSIEDYESLNETAYLLRSPRNAPRLMESIDEFESGKGKERNLIE